MLLSRAEALLGLSRGEREVRPRARRRVGPTGERARRERVGWAVGSRRKRLSRRTRVILLRASTRRVGPGAPGGRRGGGGGPRRPARALERGAEPRAQSRRGVKRRRGDPRSRLGEKNERRERSVVERERFRFVRPPGPGASRGPRVVATGRARHRVRDRPERGADREQPPGGVARRGRRPGVGGPSGGGRRRRASRRRGEPRRGVHRERSDPPPGSTGDGRSERGARDRGGGVSARPAGAASDGRERLLVGPVASVSRVGPGANAVRRRDGGVRARRGRVRVALGAPLLPQVDGAGAGVRRNARQGGDGGGGGLPPHAQHGFRARAPPGSARASVRARLGRGVFEARRAPRRRGRGDLGAVQGARPRGRPRDVLRRARRAVLRDSALGAGGAGGLVADGGGGGVRGEGARAGSLAEGGRESSFGGRGRGARDEQLG